MFMFVLQCQYMRPDEVMGHTISVFMKSTFFNTLHPATLCTSHPLQSAKPQLFLLQSAVPLLKF
jgi:hypothetical protein